MSESVFYFIFVFPLESMLGYLLDGLRALCGSYGLGIVLLSLLVNLFLLKLFLLADGMAKSHSAIKQGLDSKLREFKRVFRGMELYVYTKTLFKQKKYHPIFALKALGGLALQVPFFVAIVFLLEFHSPELVGLRFGIIEDLSKPDGLFFGVNLLPIVMSVFTLANVWISSKERASRVQGVIITLVFLVLLYRMPSALLLYWSTSMLFAMLKSIVVYRLGQAKTPMNAESATLLAPQNPHLKSYKTISIYALLCICLMVFVFNPFGFYASDVTQFESAQMAPLLGALLGFGLLSSFVGIYGVSLLSKVPRVVSFGLLSALLIGLVYNFALDYNVITGESYSQIDNFDFKNPHNISGPLNRYVDLAVGIGACLLAWVLLRFARGMLPRVLLIVLLSVGVVGGFRLVKIVSASSDFASMSKKTEMLKEASLGVSSSLPSYSDTLLTLSKNKENILIVLSDAFSGAHLPIILEQYPELAGKFEGFVHYPNALSPDGHTDLTAHTILTGHATTAWNNKSHSMRDYDLIIRNHLKKTLTHFASKYDVQTFNLPRLNADDAKELVQAQVRVYRSHDDYYGYYVARHKEFGGMLKRFSKNSFPVGELVSMGLFGFSPYTLRTANYRVRKDTHTWLFGNQMRLGSFLYAVRNASELESIVKNFKVSSRLQKPTFKYIHTQETHMPYALDQKCNITTEVPTLIPKAYTSSIGNAGHYASEICAVKKFAILLDFLKENGIYDRTMVVFVSDHSGGDSSLNGKGYYPNPLILIKDFNAKGTLRTDNRLMSNADVAGILCDVALGGCEGVEQNVLKNYPAGRVLVNTFNNYRNESARKSQRLLFEKAWEVRDSIFEPKNWREIPRDKL